MPKDFEEFDSYIKSRDYQDEMQIMLNLYRIPLDLEVELSENDQEELAMYFANMGIATALKVLRSYHDWVNDPDA